MEKFGIDFIDGGELLHVRNKDGGLDYFCERAAAGLQDCLEVVQYLAGFRPDVALYQFAAGRVDRDLAGNKELTAGLDGLRVRADGGGRIGGRDACTLHDVILSFWVGRYHRRLPKVNCGG